MQDVKERGLLTSEISEVKVVRNEGPRVKPFSDQEAEELEKPTFERRGDLKRT